MQVPVYNIQGKQIGYYTPDGRVYTYKGMRNDNLGYYFKNGKPVPGYKQAAAPAGMPSNVQRGSSQNITKQATTPTGMPTSAKQAQAAQQNKEAVNKAHSDANYNAAINAKEAQKKQQTQAARAAANQAHSDANYNAAINAKEAQKKQQVQPAAPTANNKGFLATANERIAQMTDVANTLASRPQAHQDYGYNATMYAKEARDAAKNGDIGKAAKNAAYAATNLTAAQKESSRGIPTKEEREQQTQQNEEVKPTITATATAPAPAPAPVSAPTKSKEQETVQQKTEAPIQDNFNLAQYDKWADSRLRKKFQKMGKADQYQNFINDFYGSGPMDDAKYNSIMKKYGLNNSMLNDFDIGKSNWKQNIEYVNKRINKQESKNKVPDTPVNKASDIQNVPVNKDENKTPDTQNVPANKDENKAKQEPKNKIPNMENVLANASKEDMMQFMVGQGPIYEALKNMKY